MMNSMLGALVGDAAGATLEFYNGTITEEKALHAMTMPGGGSLRVGPGQITDDGELTLSLWRALQSFESDNMLSLMKEYAKWYESCPFDIGRTCSFAFEAYYDLFEEHPTNTLHDCKTTIQTLNGTSEANGALMRATAIATWCVTHPEFNIGNGVKLAKEDAKLSHPNIVCQEVNMIYVFAIIHLLQGRTPQETLEFTNHFVLNLITSEKVKDWYFKESLDVSNMKCTSQIGHVRWGFVLAMYFLRNPMITFEEAIKITLMKGGDTDTNAAIVGGMVGAYQQIPEYMLKPVLSFDCTENSRKIRIRPEDYSVKKVIGHLI